MPAETYQRDALFAQRADLVGAAEIRKVDDEAAADDVRAGALQELDRRETGATRRDEIVHDDDVLALLHGVGMNLDAVLSIFQIVILTDHSVRQLALLAHRHEA